MSYSNAGRVQPRGPWLVSLSLRATVIIGTLALLGVLAEATGGKRVAIHRAADGHHGRRASRVRAAFDPDRERKAFAGLVHRWTRGPDLVALLWLIKQMIDRSGSIEGFFLEGYDPAAADITDALDSFSTRARTLDLKRAYGRVPQRAGVWYFFPRPSAGSACKRLNLFLRWMIRREPPDFGLWPGVAPAALLIPVDTHVENMARSLGLTRRRSRNWKMAEEITARLAALDPRDPVKYDFPLCHKRMSGQCLNRRDARVCGPCDLRPVCRHWRGRA